MSTKYAVPLEPRYAVYCHEKGVYLGGNRWTRKDPGPAEGAPTFTLDEGNVKCAELASVSDVPVAYELRLVVPDLPGHFASRNACADASLERWPGGVRVGQ